MYFKDFPKINYDISGDGVTTTIRDITLRLKVKEYIKKNISLFSKYDVQDGDTPSILAYQVYGDANKHWVILLFNDIINPYYDWPLGRQAFYAFINNKYADLNAIHHYEIAQKSGLNTTKIIVELADEPTATAVTNLEYETDLQDRKRQILLVKKGFFNLVVSDFRSEIENARR